MIRADYYLKLGDRLRLLRLSEQQTYRGMALLAGVSVPSWQRYEKAQQTVPAYVLYRLRRWRKQLEV